MQIDIMNVEHGACAFIFPPSPCPRLALVDCGHNATAKWWPSIHFKYTLKRAVVEYLFITNADHDHYSDLHDLVDVVNVHRFYRNLNFSSDQFVYTKLLDGPLSDDAQTYNALLKSHVYKEAASPPFNEGMGGITCKMFWNPYGTFTDTNNLSMAVFFHYSGFQILFPGDLKSAGWMELLKESAFREELKRTNILVASHHGREDGFCPEVFAYCGPQAVVMSDKPVEHGTQEGMAGKYAAMVAGDGIHVQGSLGKRKVLTTRSDGNIRIEVGATQYSVRIGVP